MMGPDNNARIPEVDIILWGATGFIGRLLAGYLWPRYGKTGEISFALGGNSRSELEAVHEDLDGNDRLPLIVGDAFDRPFLEEMAKKARLVVSTVGPYAKFGDNLVAACAANGTDYCDLAGEAQWMHRMIKAHQEEAKKSGARLVHACGFDSIPSDLGVLFLQNEAKRRFGGPMDRVKLRVKIMRGGASGGTVASILNFIEEARRDPDVLKIAKNPYALAPEGMRTGVRQPNVSTFEYDPDAQSWLAPFVMAAVNTRVVHRSNALMNHAWGRDFLYDEAMMMGDGIKGRFRAASFAGALGAFLIGSAFAPSRAIMKKTILPKPGEGPSPEKQEKGFYKMLLIGKDEAGHRLDVNVTGDQDPGYGSTRKMLGESAVCLFKDISRQDLKGGFWTPATAMGETLIQRLTANAGLTFDAVDSD
ncbi:MAG: saccharopine dehydrogenase NADP-binding domain-containing protein [Desulfobacterales bacterium]|nr:saccharopine dehydrogenase NADP-binding domain-containing protein [Desulfobacterales bacterium]